jgi:DNA repair ATPase RecN
MEENDINKDQIEPIIQDLATYCFRYKIPYDTIVKIGREALYLEQKYGVPIEKIPEYITQGKETIDRLEDQRQEILTQKQQASEELDAKQQEFHRIAHKFEKYREEVPSIQRIMELENELAEEMNGQHEIIEKGPRKDLYDARCEAIRLTVILRDTDARYKDRASQN